MTTDGIAVQRPSLPNLVASLDIAHAMIDMKTEKKKKTLTMWDSMISYANSSVACPGRNWEAATVNGRRGKQADGQAGYHNAAGNLLVNTLTPGK